MTSATLRLLQRCLLAQQLSVSDPGFRETAAQVLAALTELEAELAATGDAMAATSDIADAASNS